MAYNVSPGYLHLANSINQAFFRVATKYFRNQVRLLNGMEFLTHSMQPKVIKETKFVNATKFIGMRNWQENHSLIIMSKHFQETMLCNFFA